MSGDGFPPLSWRIRLVMAEREIHTVRELRKRLKAVGYEISEPQLGRVRRALPRQLDSRLLGALCAALEVQPGDLLTLRGAPAPTISRANQNAPAPTNLAPMAPKPAPAPTTSGPPADRSYPSTGPKVGRLTQPKN